MPQIVLCDYDLEWPLLFAREATRIRAALDTRVEQLEHAGSTSVPGLVAKPIIDIVLAVTSSADEAAYAEALEAAGYRFQLREPEWFEHRLFKTPEVNLHVFTKGCSEIERMLRFRDWLRAEPADRELYAAAKRELAKHDWRSVQHYANAKSDVIGSIMARAIPQSALSGDPVLR